MAKPSTNDDPPPARSTPPDDPRDAARRCATPEEALAQLAAGRDAYARARGGAERRGAAEVCRWLERRVGELAPKGCGGHGGDRKRAAYQRSLACSPAELYQFRRIAEVPLALFEAVLDRCRAQGRQPARALLLGLAEGRDEEGCNAEGGDREGGDREGGDGPRQRAAGSGSGGAGPVTGRPEGPARGLSDELRVQPGARGRSPRLPPGPASPPPLRRDERPW